MRTFEASPTPLSRDSDGVIRVEGTRLPLETLVTAFDAGATAEEIVHRFPSLDLAEMLAESGGPMTRAEQREMDRALGVQTTMGPKATRRKR